MMLFDLLIELGQNVGMFRIITANASGIERNRIQEISNIYKKVKDKSQDVSGVRVT